MLLVSSYNQGNNDPETNIYKKETITHLDTAIKLLLCVTE